MRKAEKDAIKKSAAENYNGDLNLAIAAHVHGAAVIIRSGGIIPAGADHKAISKIRASIERTEKAKTPAKKTAKKAK